MTKLEQLIEELCPDGVEFVPLWSVTIWDKRFNAVEREKQPNVINYPYLLAADLFALNVEGGDVFLLSTGEQTGWTTEELAGDKVREGEVVTMPWGKSRAVTDCIKYYKGKFVTADNRIMTSNNTEKLLNKYLYYWFMSVGKQVDAFYRGSGIKHPDMAKVLDLSIPVPPLPVQREIVKILDDFTELTEELAAELAAREKQYGYYRDLLLTQPPEMKRVPLSDVCGIFDGTHQTPKYTSEGVKFVSVENIDDLYGSTKYISEADYHEFKVSPQRGDVFMTRITAGVIGKCAVVESDEPLAYYVSLALLRPDPSKLNSKYLKFYLESHSGRKELNRYILWDATPTKINKQDIGRVMIALPELAVQEKLVDVLEHFDSICTNLNIGLPAEINARNKQYEYYRDLLLSFDSSQFVNVEREREREREPARGARMR